MPPVQTFKWIVSQIGARQHYGIPRGFLHTGQLQALYTDVWCRWGSAILRHGPRSARAFAGRYHQDLQGQQVYSFLARSAWHRWRAAPVASTEAMYGNYLRFGRAFGRWVTRDLARRSLDPARTAFFGFNTGCLETLEMLRERDIPAIVDQIDPARVEEDLVFQEVQKWPGWQETPGRIPAEYFDRLSAEWAAATFVVVNSEWSRQALLKQGVPGEKLLTVPVAYEAGDMEPVDPATKGSTQTPLTVLWIGTVNLRKGIQYLCEAARLLRRTTIRFLVAGPLEISSTAITSAPANVEFLGRISRDETDAYYRRAHLFVLPTISDGFAITQVEAMARGLPVITTPRCGQVVTPGLDGLIVAPGDARALAEAIARLDADRDLLLDMSRHALMKSRTYRLPAQASQIEHALARYRAAAEVPASSRPLASGGK